MGLYESLNKEELVDLLKAYDSYIIAAADSGRFKTGWVPVCISEFFNCEYQDVWCQGQNFEYMFEAPALKHAHDPMSLQEVTVFNDVRIFSENGSLKCHFGPVGEALVMHDLQSKIQDIKKGDAFIVGTSVYCASGDAHQNLDEPDSPWIIYDEQGDSWFEKDIVPAWEGVEKIIAANFSGVELKRPLFSVMQTASIRAAAGVELSQKDSKNIIRTADPSR